MMVPSPLNDEPLLGTPARSGGALLSTNSSYSPRSEASFYRPPSPSMEVKISRIAMIRRLSLQFVDAELERAYTEDLLRRKLRTIRVHGCFLSVVCGLLASLLFVPALELPTSRGGPPVLLILLAAAQVAWSFHRSFRRYLRVSAALLGAGVVGWVMFFVERILQEGVGESNTDNESRTNTIVFLFAVASPVISWLPLVPGLHLHHAFFFMLVLEAYLFSMTWVILESLSWASVALLLTLPYCVIHMLFGQSVHGSDRRAFLVQQFLTKENVEIQLKAARPKIVVEEEEQFEPSDIDWALDFSEIQFADEDVVGKGEYSVVRRGEYKGEKVCVKRISDPDPKYLFREIHALKSVSHPNIMRFIGFSRGTDGAFYIVSEYVEGGDLRRHLKNPSLVLSWELRTQMALDVARALAYLHSQSIMHRDVKSKNVLVDRVSYRLKLCDFGFARRQVEDKPKVMTLCGTDEWMAPEVLMGATYTLSADIFSFGILLCELITRQKPAYARVAYGPGEEAFSVDTERIVRAAPAECPPALLELALQCCSYNPPDRPTAERLVVVLSNLPQQQQLGQELSRRGRSRTISRSPIRQLFSQLSEEQLAEQKPEAEA
eukprot:TRINITY_DN2942_c0_g1_i1.p1 TRINITY_DN2942_c0_g1~~TRINITY_DN2942_c0_g1_i1.p1  ORF type:complete len:622 (+),score=130.48 TRINITY_DN2942_c0_g1_i1:54-1868(+)